MLRVLLVEDNRFDAMLVTGALSGVAEVTHAPDANVAYRHAANQLFDVAILDLDLGSLQWNIATFVKTSRRPMPVFVYSTSNISEEDARWIDGYLKKPVNGRTLVEALRETVAQVDESVSAQTVERMRLLSQNLRRISSAIV